MTNFEKLMSKMNSDVLASIIVDYAVYGCISDCPLRGKCNKSKGCFESIKDWLDSEADNE